MTSNPEKLLLETKQVALDNMVTLNDETLLPNFPSVILNWES